MNEPEKEDIDLIDKVIKAGKDLWRLQTADELLASYGTLNEEFKDRGITPYKPNDPGCAVYGFKKCESACIPRTSFGCHQGTCFFCQLKTKPPRRGQLWIGALTVVAWILFIGFMTASNSCQRETDVVNQRADDVIESLRRLP